MELAKILFLLANLSAMICAARLPYLSSRQVALGPQQFGLIAIRSASPIHLRALVAYGHGLWIGGSPTISCPATSNCTAFNNQTAFTGTYGSPVEISMDVQVPDGQTVFVVNDGAVHYTEANDNCIPEDANGDVWTLSAPGSARGNMHGSLAPVDGNKTLLACPGTAAAKNTGPWSMYIGPGGAIVPSGNTDDCWAFTTIASPAKGAIAYQYD